MLGKEMEEQLKDACVEFQRILEESAPMIATAGYICFDDFPKGCCEVSAHFLAHYLVALGLCRANEIQMPWNNYDKKGEWENASHGWIILSNGLNIDISANQFLGIEDKVIVSRDHEVHKRFVGGELVSFEEHHRRSIWYDNGESFNHAWAIIMKKLNKTLHPTIGSSSLNSGFRTRCE
jgi:hypothetical protein